MKRSPLKRTTPLKRTPMRRKRNAKKDAEWSAVRKQVIQSRGYRCEVRGPKCSGQPDHVHHKRRRSQGGTNEPHNLVVCCLFCHDWIHRNVSESVERGFLISVQK